MELRGIARTSAPAAALIASLSWLAVAALAQVRVTDDAGRTVEIPSRVERALAAGFPAEVLLHTLAPDLLAARNRVPEGEALAFFPAAYHAPRLIRQLPEVDNPAADAELVAIDPDVFIDYGTVDGDYAAVLDAVRTRTGVPGLLFDGNLERIPATYRRLGAVLGTAARAERLAAETERLLAKYRGSLASSPPRVYMACSSDGFVPCLADERNGEQLALLGAVNVAGTRATAPRRPLTIAEIRALKPDVIVVNGPPGAAARLRADSEWQSVGAVAAGRVHQPPSLPYSWGPRPPSVNRLPGVMWLAYVLPGREFDEAFYEDVRRFYSEFYQVTLTDAQMQWLVAE